MTRDEAVRAVYTDEEIQALVDEQVNLYWNKLSCPRPYETPDEKAMRAEQEERIDRENALCERMGL